MRRNTICNLFLSVVFLTGISCGDHIKVDLDAANYVTADGFSSWLSSDGTTKTFSDVTVSLQMPDLPDDTEWKINWYNKAGRDVYNLAMDCLYGNFDDETESHPSYENVPIVMTLTGLSEGAHTLISYHNAPWPQERYERVIAACTIYIDDVETTTVQPSQYATNDSDIESTFLTFHANADTPVKIRFEPIGDPNSDICTAVLNGFEIDNLASVDSYARQPVPDNGNMHLFANNDEPSAGSAGCGYTTLSWTASDFAVYHDVYFGTDETIVTNADQTTTGIYRGRQGGSETTWDANDLDSRNTYYWRIDTVKSDGSLTRGYTWSFRTRHLAYPDAEGYGRFARGGRGGSIVEVTTLADYDPNSQSPIDGSLRQAIETQTGPRIIVFRVGGTIELKAKLVIPSDGGDVYVAGQTAPGEGICLTGYSFGMMGASDAIIRFIRTRVGDQAQTSLDGMGMASSNHCIIDHCSISWSIDEGHSSRSAENITFSYNIISEALNSSYQYADHSFAASISGNIGSYHHNLLAHCTGRNWSLAGGLDSSNNYAGYCDIRNNVVYNWVDRTTDGGVYRCNFVNNLYIPGPATTLFLLMRPDGDQMGTGDPQMFYIAGNQLEGYAQYDADNWDGVSPNYATESEIRSDTAFFPSYVTTESISDAYANVIAHAGAIRPMRDAIDTRIIDDVVNRSYTYRGSVENLPGIIDSQTDVGGYPKLAGGPVPVDTDHDGLPDWWEQKLGLDPNSTIGTFTDTNADPDGDGFTNMEDYLDYLANGGTQFQTYHCTAAIAGDLDGNCRVNLKDFAILSAAWDNSDESILLDLQQLAENWLLCNRDPESQCRLGYDCVVAIASDLNNDCKVDMNDYAILAAAWMDENSGIDLNNDAAVDWSDLVQMALEWLACDRQPHSQCP